MGNQPLRVVLLMETSLVSSALAQVLARDPRLSVEVQPPGSTLDPVTAPPSTGCRPRTVGIAVLGDPQMENPDLDNPDAEDVDKPVQIELHADGNVWVHDYRGLDALSALLNQW